MGFFDRAVERLREVGRRNRTRTHEHREGYGAPRVRRDVPVRDPATAYMPGGGTTGNPLWSGMRSRYEREYQGGHAPGDGYGDARDRARREGERGWYEGDPYWRPTFRAGDDPNRVYASGPRAGVWGAPDERRGHWQGRGREYEGLNEEVRSFPRREGPGESSGHRFVDEFAYERGEYDREHARSREYTRGRDEWSYGARDESDRYERAGYGARWEDDARGERPQGRAWGGPDRGSWEDADRARRFGRAGLGYEGPERGEPREQARYGRDDYERVPESYDSRTQREPGQRTDSEARRGAEWDRGQRGRR